MKIKITVKIKAKKELVEKIGDDHYVVKVNAAPVEGAANKRVIEFLSKYLGLPKSSLTLIRGHKSKIKVIEILG